MCENLIGTQPETPDAVGGTNCVAAGRGLRAKRSLHGPMQRAACSTARSAEALIDFRKYSGYNEHVCLSCGRTLW